MTKDFDLNSPNWLDMIFEKRNRQYGAYALRADSSNRHIKSLIIVFIASLFAIFLPRIIDSIEWGTKDVVQTTDVNMRDIFQDNLKDETPVVEQIPEIPPPVLKEAVKVTDVAIVDDKDVQDDNTMKAALELDKSDADIHTKDIKGQEGGESVFDVPHPDPEPVIEKKIYRYVQQKPSFPGGQEALTRWLTDNLRYPSQAQEAGIQGQVQVEFVVRANGKVDGIKVVKPDHASLNREAERLINQMAKEKTWIPGKQNGTSVDVYFICPINFKLN
jgi:protein TonB